MLSGPSSLWLISFFSTKTDAIESLLNFTVDTLFRTNTGIIPYQEEYNSITERIPKEKIYDRGRTIGDTVMALLRQRREVQSEINRHKDLAKKARTFIAARYQEYEALLDEILPVDFLKTLTYSDLEDCNRYMKSLLLRITRAHSDYSKDDKKAENLRPHIRNLEMLYQRKNLSDDCLGKAREYQKLIHEWRISLFSPEIKTKLSVSAKKLEKTWQELLNVC